ncbi:hypothetical protein N9850_06340 [Granulosicoccus sp.]|nr:radical SAM protein [Granulosicoccus sp.]MDB4223372.1 hypothetical protein [Granulosicoccus sp.]
MIKQPERENLTSEEIARWAEIKFGLLAEGARISQSAKEALFGSKQPIRTRSGVSGGLDIALDGYIDVNVPVTEAFTFSSTFRLDFSGDVFLVTRHGKEICEFIPQPTPSYYEGKLTESGEEMRRIGQMCSGDRFCYGMTGPTCYFWKKERRCKYCSISNNFDEDAARKQKTHFNEVLDAAISDDRLPAKHVLLGGGTPKGDDMGAIMASEYCRELKEKHPDISVYVMIAAPLENKYIDLLHSSGADELGMNLEFWSDHAWQNYIPGKNEKIGKDRYLRALEYSVNVFGPINTRSILIAGLEDLEHTLEAGIHLVNMGVMPILSPFRPLDGTMLENHRGATGAEYVDLWTRLDEKAEPLGIPVGPSCKACQNNTLALPFGSRYRSY